MRGRSRSNLATAIAIVTMVLNSPTKAADTILIKIDTGSVRGTEANGVVSFKGIPYARPPVKRMSHHERLLNPLFVDILVEGFLRGALMD